MLKLVGDDVPSIEEFMTRYRVRHTILLYVITLTITIDGSSGSITQAESRSTCHSRALK